MPRALSVILAMAVFLSAGVANGLRTGRWAASSEVEAAAARLARVPATIGDWAGKDEEIDPRMLTAAGAAGCVSRSYEDRRDGARVSVLLLCGPPGPISVHPPNVCYAANGFDLAGITAARVDRPSGVDQFRVGDFRKPAVGGPARLEILWAWNAGGAWSAPERPRFAFAAAPVLYKLYVIRDVSAAGRTADRDVPREFLREFLPEVDRALFPAKGA
jgi:hypothetical protein